MDLPNSTETAQPRRLLDRLSHLVELSLVLNSTLDPDRLLQVIIDTAAHILECEAVSLMLYDEPTRQLRFAAATGSDPARLAQIPVPLERSIAGTIFTENHPLLIHDVAAHPRHYALVGQHVRFEVRSLIGVPMRLQKQVIGVLEALNRSEGEFTQEDVHVLSIIASQAALAIHNARMVQALQGAYSEISRVDAIKTNFLALASHELRTPLGIILGYATFLRDEAQGELSEHAATVLNAALQMRSVLESMSNMNLMRSGSQEFRPQRTCLKTILQAASAESTDLAQARGQEICLFLPEEPLFVRADPPRLQLVFSNLLSNAIKFSPNGRQIVVALTARDGRALVGVQDDGIGIPPEALERIFEEFYQVEGSLTRRYGGLGLGLTIARGLVSLHGGRLWAESGGPGQGALFKVELPEEQG